MRKLILPALLVIAGCANSTQEESGKNQSYFFDLKEYFEKEASRLSAENAPVMKEVIRNNSTESHQVQINWKQELELFAQSDINKPAWKDSYRKVDSANVTSYVAVDDDLRTRKIVLERGTEGRLTHIQIINETSNFLYNSVEKLDYYPGKGYSIDKSQQVRALGKNHYRINTTLK